MGGHRGEAVLKRMAGRKYMNLVIYSIYQLYNRS